MADSDDVYYHDNTIGENVVNWLITLYKLCVTLDTTDKKPWNEGRKWQRICIRDVFKKGKKMNTN